MFVRETNQGVTFRSALTFGYEGLAELLNRSFSGYIVDIRITPEMLAEMIRSQGIDLAVSCIAYAGDNTIACGLVGRRGRVSRVAGMGVAPEARRRGVGRQVMQHLIREARDRGEHTMVLEVIEQNRAALLLYQQLGFQRVRRLVGYATTTVPRGVVSPDLQEVSLEIVGAQLLLHGVDNMPWQAAGATVVQMALPARGYKLGPAYIAISDPTREQIIIHGLVVTPDHSLQEAGVRLLRALFARYRGRSWRVPVVFPEEVASELFDVVGFKQESLTQLQLSLDLRM